MKGAGLILFVTLLIGGIVGAWLWPYSINTWLMFFNKPQTVVWWHGVLLGFCPIIGHATIPVAVVTWILMLFLI